MTTGQCTGTLEFGAAVASDNCAVHAITQTGGLSNLTTVNASTNTITFFATDTSNNNASCSFTVQVRDEEAPHIVCPSNVNVNTIPGTCVAQANYTSPTGTDNCPGPSTTRLTGGAPLSNFSRGTTTVWFMAVDSVGNNANCSFSVTVADNELPTISTY